MAEAVPALNSIQITKENIQMLRLASISMTLIATSLSVFAGVPGTIPSASVVPEPSTVLVMAAGVVGAVLFAKGRKSRK
jgi:hypothetical protein